MMPVNGSGSEQSLRDQWVSRTFQATRQDSRLRGFPLTTMQHVVDEVVRDQSAELILAHDPWPADNDSEGTARRASAAGSEGLTRTALLEVFMDWVKARGDCVLVAFDTADMSDQGNFFKSHFIPEFVRRHPPLAYRSRVSDLISVFNRTILIGTELKLAPKVGISASGASVLLATVARAALNPQAQTQAAQQLSGTASYLASLGEYLPLLALLFAIVLGSSLLGFYRKYQKTPSLQEEWRTTSPSSVRARAFERACRDASEPSPGDDGRMANHHIARAAKLFPIRPAHVIVINDLEFTDSASLNDLLDLFQEAQTHKRASLCLVLGFNPTSPALMMSHRQQIPQALAHRALSWAEPEDIEIRPLEYGDVRANLRRYLGRGNASAVLKIIDECEASGDFSAERLQLFFDTMAAEVADSGRDLTNLRLSDLETRLHEFSNRDNRAAAEVVAAVKEKDRTGQSMLLLKLVLADFATLKRAQYVQLLKRIDQKYAHAQAHEKVLIEQLKILRSDSPRDTYEFADRHLAAVLRQDWPATDDPDWRKTLQDLATRIFLLLCEPGGGVTGAAEQALRSYPSRQAIEVLAGHTLFLDGYFESADAGTMLRFTSGEPGSALDKWWRLCQDVVATNENLWTVVAWTTLSGYNPYRRSRAAPPEFFFAPDMLAFAARNYWLTGRTDEALRWLTERWDWIEARLPSDFPDAWAGTGLPEECTRRLSRARAEISLLTSRILVHRGSGNSWSEAVRGLEPYVRGELPTTPVQLGEARWLTLTVAYYRAAGTAPAWGSSLPAVSATDDLVRLAHSTDAGALARLRALRLLVDRTWFLRRADPSAWASLEAHTQTALDLLTSLRSMPPTDDVADELGSRSDDAETFAWEGIYLYLACVCAVRLHSAPPAGGMLADFEKLIRQPMLMGQWKTDAERSVQRARRAASTRDGPAAGDGQAAVQLAMDVLSACAGQAEDQLDLAAALYRRLAHRPGYAEVLHLRGLVRLSLERTRQWLTGEQVRDRAPQEDDAESAQNWFEQRLRYSEELGFYLEHPQAHLLVVPEWDAGNLFRRIGHYRAALAWFEEPGPGLPDLIGAELRKALGDALTRAPQPAPEALALYRAALVGYERAAATGVVPSGAQDELTRDVLSVRWGLANEILAALRQQPHWPVADRLGMLEEAEHHLNICIAAHRERGDEAQENSCTLLLALVHASRGEIQQSVNALRGCLDYYKRTDEWYWGVQVATEMLILFDAHASAEVAQQQPLLESSERADLYAYLRVALEGVEDRFRTNFRSMSYGEILVMHMGALRIGLYDAAENSPDSALNWLLLCFDALASLGFCGSALLLDPLIHNTLRALNDPDLRRAYSERLERTIVRIRPDEPVNMGLVAEIVASYMGDRVSLGSVSPVKQDCINRYRSFCAVNNQPAARAALEEGRKLIRDSEPEQMDVELLTLLRDVYEDEDETEAANKVAAQRARIEDHLQTRMFLRLAEAYEATQRDPRWALNIAMSVNYTQTGEYAKAIRMKQRYPPRTDNRRPEPPPKRTAGRPRARPAAEVQPAGV